MTELKGLFAAHSCYEDAQRISRFTARVSKTGASTATISRVNRSLNYGCDGYEKIFERIDAAEVEKKD